MFRLTIGSCCFGIFNLFLARLNMAIMIIMIRVIMIIGINCRMTVGCVSMVLIALLAKSVSFVTFVGRSAVSVT